MRCASHQFPCACLNCKPDSTGLSVWFARCSTCENSLRTVGFVLSTPPGRTRSAFNVRPAPVPPAFAGVTRVGHDSCPWPCGPPVWCNEPPHTKGTLNGTQQFRTRAGNQSAGLLRLACRQQGRQRVLDLHRSRLVPPRPQGAFASAGSDANQWPARPSHTARRREEGTGRLAPGLGSIGA